MRPLTLRYLKSTTGQKKFPTWRAIVKYFFPHISNEYADYILWNDTCFPFSHEITLDQLYERYRGPKPANSSSRSQTKPQKRG